MCVLQHISSNSDFFIITSSFILFAFNFVSLSTSPDSCQHLMLLTMFGS
ncbi:hypothetical protein ACJIZ3_023616 [Penstemon smallii]|uniref:Uncharacterized protein n=1 Tax=Penstemon smallii TaxID=265156 RepID=A0ABD3TQL2_9LAMI